MPGLLGTILTMTMLIFTALSVTREIERGTMESLLAMPIKPLEIMIGKIAPYIVIGFMQAALILGFGIFLFEVPIEGSVLLLAALSTLFIATNLSIGYTFSTIAQNQLQAIQMSFMFFLPNILLSGFMFPFAGMPRWAQWIGELLPLTHYIRIVRGIMLKGANLYDLQIEALALAGPHAARHDAGRAPLPPHAGLSVGPIPRSPLAGVGHRRPGLLLGLRLALLQQLDRDVVGRADEGHAPVARRPVDGDAGLHQPVAGGVDVVDLERQMPEIAAFAIVFRIPVDR